MMEGTIGEVRMFGGNFAPRAWAFCEGQLLSIAQNQALFSILGTTYGGDGRTTFALPDLRGRSPIGPGTGPGLTTRKLGQRSGTETNQLTQNQLPAHSHGTTVNLTGVVAPLANSDTGNDGIPGPTSYPAEPNPGTNIYNTGTPDTTLGQSPVSITGTVVVGNTGANQPINNMQPFLGLYYIICLQGVFPSRS
ncbi:phage tail protein [bacterium SCSIO 12643]|nr:phage tail protein [bacterium SCSIO 12643]